MESLKKHISAGDKDVEMYEEMIDRHQPCGLCKGTAFSSQSLSFEAG